jgi:hypothetical protein
MQASVAVARARAAATLMVPRSACLIGLPDNIYLKERFLSHRLHNDYDAIVEAACKAWRKLPAEVGRIKSLCTYPWIPNVKT